MENKIIETINLSVKFGSKVAIESINITIPKNRVTALIGPSGCGKSTFIRSLNRMHDYTQTAKITGKVLLDGKDIYSPDVDPISIRRRVGMVFQQPNPFLTMSIYET